MAFTQASIPAYPGLAVSEDAEDAVSARVMLPI